jgi:hypothetical protein
MMRARTLAVVLSIVAAPAWAADPPTHVKVLVGGFYQLGTQSYSQTISFDQYQETATIANSYTADKAPGFDVGVEYDAFKHLGFSVAGTFCNRDLNASYDASFPHPLFFDTPRTATGEIAGKQKETAWHVNVVAFGRSGAFEFSGWAGVSFFKVEADLLENVTYSQSYPYDTVTVTATPTTRASDSPVGFNVGASADWRFSPHVGAGILARFTRATAQFTVTNATSVDVDAGGVQVGAGLRFYF